MDRAGGARYITVSPTQDPPMPPADNADVSRRDVIKGLAALGAVPAVAGSVLARAGTAAAPTRAPDLIARENAKAGTRDWMLTHTRIDPKTKYRCPWVEGFCSRTSLRAGEKLDLFVSTDPPSPLRIDFYRTGYYGGAGGRHVHSITGLKGM